VIILEYQKRSLYSVKGIYPQKLAEETKDKEEDPRYV